MPKSKTDYTHKKFDDGISTRTIEFRDPDGYKNVVVTQGVDLDTHTYGVSVIDCDFGPASVDKARYFYNALAEALVLAKIWDEQAGKTPKKLRKVATRKETK